jgi:carbonic anhydrase
MTNVLPEPAATVLATLLEGNERYASDQPRHPHRGRETRTSLEGGQRPIAAVLACSDARVPPTLVFDQGLGDLFIVRNAGQVLTPGALASLEFAVLELGVSLIAVLAHEGCGAVRAAAGTFGGDTIPEGHLAQVLAPLAPAVAFAARRSPPGAGVDALACRAGTAHLRMTVAALRTAGPVIATRIERGSLGVAGLTYELASGRTRVLDAAATERPTPA